MTGIDYEALAKAGWDARNDHLWQGQGMRATRDEWDFAVHAFVSGLRDQGMVVVGADDLAFVLDEFVPDDVVRDRLRAALAAPDEGDPT